MHATYYPLVPFTLELSHELSAFSNGKNLCYLRVISKAVSNTNESETETRTGIHISFEAWLIWSRVMTKAKTHQDCFTLRFPVSVSGALQASRLSLFSQSKPIPSGSICGYLLTNSDEKPGEEKPRQKRMPVFGVSLTSPSPGLPWWRLSLRTLAFLLHSELPVTLKYALHSHLRVLIPPLGPLGFQNGVSKASGTDRL